MNYNEEEDRAYTEWEMKQPGYWRDNAVIFTVLVTIAAVVAFLVGAGA